MDEPALPEIEYTRSLRELVRQHRLPFLRGRAIDPGEPGAQPFFITDESLDQAIAFWGYLPESAYRAAKLRCAPDRRACTGQPVDLDSPARLARPGPPVLSEQQQKFLAQAHGRAAVRKVPAGEAGMGLEMYWVTRDGSELEAFTSLPQACRFLGPEAFALCRREGWTNKDLIEQLEKEDEAQNQPRMAGANNTEEVRSERRA